MHLIPSDSIGSVKLKEFKTKPTELRISTGSKSRAASSLGNFLVGDKDFLKPYGTEGSIVLFNLNPGTYQITWQFYTAETDGSDLFLLWDGEELTEWATRPYAREAGVEPRYARNGTFVLRNVKNPCIYQEPCIY